MLSKYHYYTGIIFQAYTYGTGEALIKGGRYNQLMKHFGKPAASIGFAIVVDNLLMALSRQKIEMEEEEGVTVITYRKENRIQAIQKAKELRAQGRNVALRPEKVTKDSRKLIFVNEELKLRFFLAKGPDVPTYVEYGAADIGIVGKDTILEEGRKLYEVMDLGFGACRMCVCGPESAKPLLNSNQLIRVATKYPNIAKDYFYNKKHQTVEIIKLNGSIELAPIVGLSEVICDIVETGSTLRENGLSVLEEVCPLSARMVVNQVSMKMENERITKLISDLKTVI